MIFFQIKSQPTARYIVRIVGNDSAKICKQFPFPASNFNELIYKKQINDWLLKVQSQGYLSANIDSIVSHQSDSKIMVWLGAQYHWINVKWNTQDAEWAAQTGIDISNFSGKNIQFKKWFAVAEKILNDAENNGFPFAEIKLDSVVIQHDSIAAKIKLDKHLKVIIDSIHCSNRGVVNQKYLYKYLGLKSNLLYNEASIKKINGLLNGLSFLKQVQPYSVTFIGEHATVNLNLQNQKSSRFNFLIGLLPNNTNPQTSGTANNSKFLLSGEGDLHLENIQSSANVLDMMFRLYPQQTQNLVAKYNHPFLLGLPFGTDARFEIYKHDSTYIDVDFTMGIQHILLGRNYLKLFYTTHQSALTYVDTFTIKLTRTLPSILDYKSNVIGVEWYKEKLNYRFNPSQGFVLKFNIGAGYKQFIQNNQIENLTDATFSFSKLYDSIKHPIFHTSFDFLIAAYFPIYKAHILKLQCSGIGTPDKKIFNNEVQRIGGNRNLRGFDEQSIATTLYSLLTIEYRYLLDKNSYAYSFYDLAYTEIKTTSVRQFDKPYGFGVGLAFETKAGIFQMSYALGSKLNNPILIRNGKIHFGYLVSF